MFLLSPNCTIQYKLCSCGRIHGYLQTLIPWRRALLCVWVTPLLKRLTSSFSLTGGPFANSGSVVPASSFGLTSMVYKLLLTPSLFRSTVVRTPPMPKPWVPSMLCYLRQNTFPNSALPVSSSRETTAPSRFYDTHWQISASGPPTTALRRTTCFPSPSCSLGLHSARV